MGAKSLPYETRKLIYELGQKFPEVGSHSLCKQVGVHKDAFHKYRSVEPEPEVVLAQQVPDLESDIKRLLAKNAMSREELADSLDLRPSERARVDKAIEQMKARGVMLIQVFGGKWELASSVLLEPGKSEVTGSEHDEWTHRFGVTTDNHLCNKHSRLDVLNAAYDHFQRVGITDVYNCGNWLDGEAKFNKTELITRPGMDSQIDYFIENFPQRKGMTTHYVAGSDHEGWWQEREGVEVGRYLQLKAEEAGRHDLKYLGYAEADVALKCGGGSAVMRVLHPGGGSAYAISYTDQKRTESYQGGEKPQLELVGHFHKFNHGYPREVHTVQCGCTSDQSLFMRKKRIQAHVGFVTVKVKQDSTDGHITRVAVEFFPFYDRGYYEKRF